MKTFIFANKSEQKAIKNNLYSSTKFEEQKKFLDKLKEGLESITFETEEQKSAYEGKIMSKINAGEKLTAQELNYLRRNNPELYQKVMRLEIKRKSLEQRLKNCKSKKEAAEIISNEIANVSKKDPDRELIIKVIEKTIKEFKKSAKYQSLPNKDEEEEEKKNCKSKHYDTDGITGLYNQDRKSNSLKTETENFDLKI